jgi:hypothetical protein
VAVLMYAPAPSDHGDAAAAPTPTRTASGAQIGWASPEAVSGTITALNAEVLLMGEASVDSGEEPPPVVRVPVLTALSIGFCVAFTVVFGIIPAPILDLTNHASLLFLAH